MLSVYYPFVLSAILYVVQLSYILQVRGLVTPKTYWLEEADLGLRTLFIVFIRYLLIYNKSHLRSVLLIQVIAL